MSKFVKGQSGNPGGRPKESSEIKDLARVRCPEAIERLLFWMRSDNPKASVQSCIAILDRAYGKPTQPLEHSGAIALIEELKAARERAGIAEPVRPN